MVFIFVIKSNNINFFMTPNIFDYKMFYIIETGGFYEIKKPSSH
jgi:hypothetical protein